jgi:hypothetical protein
MKNQLGVKEESTMQFNIPGTNRMMLAIDAAVIEHAPTITLYRVRQINMRKGPELFSAVYTCVFEPPFRLRWEIDRKHPHTRKQIRMMPSQWNRWNADSLATSPKNAWDDYIEEIKRKREACLGSATHLTRSISKAEKHLKRLEKETTK